MQWRAGGKETAEQNLNAGGMQKTRELFLQAPLAARPGLTHIDIPELYPPRVRAATSTACAQETVTVTRMLWGRGAADQLECFGPRGVTVRSMCCGRARGGSRADEATI